MLFVPVIGLRVSALGVVGLTLTLGAYDFVFQKIHAVKILNLRLFTPVLVEWPHMRLRQVPDLLAIFLIKILF